MTRIRTRTRTCCCTQRNRASPSLEKWLRLVVICGMWSSWLSSTRWFVRSEECKVKNNTSAENGFPQIVENFVDIHRGVLPIGRALSRGNVLPIMSTARGTAHWVVTTTKDLKERWFHDPYQVTFYGLRLTHQPSPWIGDYGQFIIAPEVDGLGNSIYSLQKSLYKPHLFKGKLLNYCSRHGCTEVRFAPSQSGGIMETYFPPDLLGTRKIALVLKDGEINIFKDEKTNRFYIEGFSSSYNKGVVDKESRITRDGLQVKSRYRTYFSASLDVSDIPDAFDFEGEGMCNADNCFAIISWSPSDSNQAQTATLRISTSFISVEQARINNERELNRFEGVNALANYAAKSWNKLLARIDIEVEQNTMPNYNSIVEQKTQFYTCLYRALLFPRVIREIQVDGKEVHMSPYTSPAMVRPGPVSTDSGFWDAYRTVYPFLHLVYPDLVRDVLRGWVNAYRDLGRVPQWPSPGPRIEMVSTMSDISFAEGIVNGAFDEEDARVAFEAIIRNAYHYDRGSESRGEHLRRFADLGFIPGRVSETLNMALCDYAIAQAAHVFGKQDIAADLQLRSGFWKNLFDQDTGFFRPKHANGSFYESFNEFEWLGAYIEGGPWQYRFAVPHDAAKLAQAYGGPNAMCAKLQETVKGISTFYLPDVVHEATEMGAHCFGQYAHNNQPTHHILYMFAHAGPTCALEGQEWIQFVLQTLYGTFGYAGDEDNGEMSSWYLLSSIGLYALVPGSGKYQVGAPPLFKKITINRPYNLGGTLTISRSSGLPVHNSTGTPQYIAPSVRWREQNYSLQDGPVNLPYQELLKGGELMFYV